MRYSRRWSLVALLVLFAAVAAPPSLLGQVVTEIVVMPSSACVGKPVAVRLQGTGTCPDLQVDFGGGIVVPTPSPTFPVQVDMPSPFYQAAGVEDIEILTQDCTVVAPSNPVQIQVNSCLSRAPDGGRTFTPIVEWGGASLHDPRGDLIPLNPEVTRHLGFAQPGGPLFLIFGERLPIKGEESTAAAFLGTSAGTVTLQVEEWSSTGTWGALSVPDEPWITGVGDHPALLWVRSSKGFDSNWHAVSFTAAREVKVLPESDVEVVSCGTDGNFDCCSGRSDPDDTTWGPVVGEISPGCLHVASSSFYGQHANDCATVGNDAGTDTYRIELENGWVIEQIDFVSKPSEEGEAAAFRATLASPAGASSWDESITWSVSPCDDVFYHSRIFITGPRATSHK